MYFSRVTLVSTTGFALLLLSILGSSGCTGKLQGSKTQTVTINCGAKNVTVDINNGADLRHLAIYVCEGDTVTWHAPHDVIFSITFSGGCPFTSCPAIDNNNPTSPPAAAVVDLTVFKYTITVNGKPFDPHVVAGGGHGG